MKTSYHCIQCDKEFLDPSIANNHRNTTGTQHNRTLIRSMTGVEL